MEVSNEIFYIYFPGVENIRNLMSTINITNYPLKNTTFGNTAGVISPNLDTLYVVANIDCNDTKIDLYLPNFGDRYFIAQFVDLWCNNFYYIINNNRYNHYIIEYNQDKKSENNLIYSPSPFFLLIIRVYANYYSEEDIKLAANLVEQIQINGKLGLSPFPKTEVNPKNTPIDVKYFIDRALLINKYQEKYDNFLNKISKINPNLLYSGFSQAQASILTALNTVVIGWQPFSASVNSFFKFALVQWQGLYANNENANVLYYFNKFDIFSNQYNGNNKYKLIFKNGQLPPVDGFWSITFYNNAGFLVENIYNRYNVGTASEPIPDSNNDIILYLQNEIYEPINNWLPLPKEDGYFLLRAYGLLDLNYVPPKIITRI